MPNTAVAYAFALLLGSTIVGAQAAKTTSETKVRADDGKVVMMVGCVEIGGGTSVVLTNITSERDHSKHGRHESTDVPRGGPYSLVARKGLDLSAYILQKVELTGVVIPAATSRDQEEKIKIKETTKVEAEHGPDKTSSTVTTAKVERGATPQFLVASIKAIAPNCQP